MIQGWDADIGDSAIPWPRRLAKATTVDMRCSMLLRSLYDGPGFWLRMEQATGIGNQSWRAVFHGRRGASSAMLEVLAKRHPDIALWLVSGTAPTRQIAHRRPSAPTTAAAPRRDRDAQLAHAAARAAALAQVRRLGAEFAVRAYELTYPKWVVAPPERVVMGALYRGPDNGQEWVARRGQRPRWLLELCASGAARLDDLRVRGQPHAPTTESGAALGPPSVPSARRGRPRP